jgi:hypothetical protein
MRLLTIGIVWGITAATSLAQTGNWPQWRGPLANGHSPERGVPVRWDAKSIVWKTPLPGNGQSTPVIWGDRMFLTSALQQGKKRLVYCLDRYK